MTEVLARTAQGVGFGSRFWRVLGFMFSGRVSPWLPCVTEEPPHLMVDKKQRKRKTGRDQNIAPVT